MMAETPSNADELTAREFSPNARLYHFTNASGLYGILTSQCIWATHYRFLNDTSEFFAAFETLKAYIEKKLPYALARLVVNHHRRLAAHVDKEAYLKDQAEHLTRSIYDAFLKRLDGFVFSLFLGEVMPDQSHSADSLVHWAAYGRGGGYALEFNPQKLLNIFEREAFQEGGSTVCTPAIYAPKGVVPPELEQSFDVAAKFVEEIFEKSGQALGEEVYDDLARIAGPLMTILTAIKDPFFEVEREYRLVVMRDREQCGPKVYFRDVGETKVPFIKLISGFLSSDLCPLERIIVGPQHQVQAREIELRTFLDLNNCGHIDVETSRAPYRLATFG